MAARAARNRGPLVLSKDKVLRAPRTDARGKIGQAGRVVHYSKSCGSTSESDHSRSFERVPASSAFAPLATESSAVCMVDVTGDQRVAGGMRPSLPPSPLAECQISAFEDYVVDFQRRQSITY